MPDVEQRQVDATLTLSCQEIWDLTLGSDPYEAIVTAQPPSGFSWSGPDAITIERSVCDAPIGGYVFEASFQVAASLEAPGEVAHTFQVGVEVDTVLTQSLTVASKWVGWLEARASSQNVTVDAYGNMSVEVTNLGNAVARVHFEPIEAPPDLILILPDEVFLERGATETFPITFAAATTGWGQATATLGLQPSSTLDPFLFGPAIQVPILATEAPRPAEDETGKDSPAPMLLPALVGLALVKRHHRKQ